MRKALTVHPRVCGADSEKRAGVTAGGGSPPRVRGRRNIPFRRRRRSRFTPACAGQTGSKPNEPFLMSVHPRVCGADMVMLSQDGGATGSPPRVRGRQAYKRSYIFTSRFTPACAGQTSRHSGEQNTAPVHPRVCGADGKRQFNRARYLGSPPRVRGRLIQADGGSGPARFTPACAGQTPGRIRESARNAVHPACAGQT